jgi:hypothetical protein
MNGRRRVYIDSSVLGWCLNRTQVQRCAEANLLMAQVKKGLFEGGYSWVAVEEIEAAPDKIKERLWQIVLSSKLTRIPDSIKNDAIALADKYMREGIFPSRSRPDAEHIAMATLWGADCVVSYNFQHIVKLETMVAVNSKNKALGLREVFLCQPKEVIVHED